MSRGWPEKSRKGGANVTREAGNVTGTAVPVTDDLFRQLAEITGRVDPEHSWTAKMVGEELVSALRLLHRVGGSVGPRFKATNFPEVVRDWEEVLAGIDPEDAERDLPQRSSPTPRQITRMEQVMRWQTLYLADHEGPRRVLKVWLRTKFTRAAFGEACKRLGWSRATAYRARDRALFLIAIGLMKDGVRP